jgi:hypothetical protein
MQEQLESPITAAYYGLLERRVRVLVRDGNVRYAVTGVLDECDISLHEGIGNLYILGCPESVESVFGLPKEVYGPRPILIIGEKVLSLVEDCCYTPAVKSEG